jgi:hypothetical protein
MSLWQQGKLAPVGDKALKTLRLETTRKHLGPCGRGRGRGRGRGGEGEGRGEEGRGGERRGEEGRGGEVGEDMNQIPREG